MRRIRTGFFGVALALFISLSAVSAFAGPAEDVVKDKQAQLFAALRAPSSQKKVEEIFNQLLDYDALAQASLGNEWGNLSKEEQAQFSDLLKQLVKRAYEKNLRKTLDFNIEYVGEEPAGSAVKVKTKASPKAGKSTELPVEIEFKMVEKNSAWKVNDIVTEGVSLVGNYRSQFVKTIKNEKFSGLIEKMKKKLKSGDV